VPRISWEQLDGEMGETSAQVRTRVADARQRQQTRGHLNARIPLNRMDSICKLTGADKELLRKAAHRFRLSPRAIHRILKVARTIADLAGQDAIQGKHLQEAIAYRGLDND